MLTQSLMHFLNNEGIEYQLSAEMKEHTTFKIGGEAECLCYPKTVEDIKEIIKICKNDNIPFFVLGNGSNLLVSDNGIDGIVVSLKNISGIFLSSALEISCGAGLKLSKLCSFALENSLTGLEFLWGIPGTVGGAVYMNAGAYNGEISMVLKECTYLDPDGKLVQADVSSLGFDYRKSIFQSDSYVIIEAKFLLKAGNKEAIKAQMDNLIARRKEKQPLEYPSAGSTFKRPTGYYAAALIEECGLKGAFVGDAEVSEKHSGFIINKGEATCGDVLSLIKKVKEQVFLQKSVTLETEVKYIGKN